MKNIPPIGLLTLKRNHKKQKLQQNLESLIADLSDKLEQLKTNPYYKPNNLGIIQGKGMEIDLLCAEIDALCETIELLSE